MKWHKDTQLLSVKYLNLRDLASISWKHSGWKFVLFYDTLFNFV
jgi:hypothetical protein